MSGKKEIKYRIPGGPNKTETLTDVTAVECVGQSNGKHMALIITHTETQENTVIEPVTDLFGVRDI